MLNRVRVELSPLVAASLLGWLAGCLNGPAGASPDSGLESSGGDGTLNGTETGDGRGDGIGNGGPSDAGVTDAGADAAVPSLGLLIDNMTSMSGTQISLQVPGGEIPGSYYAYSDYPASNDLGMMSSVSGTPQLVDVPISSPITNADGSQIVGEICFGGSVAGFAGLGMSLAYAPADAPQDPNCPPGAPPVAFDASHYGGVSFYILVDASDGAQPSLHFGVPDTQTGDKCVRPTPACAVDDGGGCYDDFGSDFAVAPGSWTKVAFKWSDLAQQTWGSQFSGGLKIDQLIGMKWQANGPAVGDAAVESFRFCISDIYFTP